VAALLRGVNPSRFEATSSITVGELVYGAHRLQEHREALLAKLDTVLFPNLLVLAFDAAAARHYGALRAELERRGTPIGEADLRIGLSH